MLSRIVTENLIDNNNDTQYQLKYFDEEERIWQKLSKTAICTERASLVVAGKDLYAIGSAHNGDMVDSSYNEDMYQGDSFQYDANQNIWKGLSSMLEIHGPTPQVVYLDGYIYVFGNPFYYGLAERYSVTEQVWEMLPDLPNPYYNCSSAIVYDGNILVCDNSFEDTTHAIYGYNPNTNTWQVVLPQSNMSKYMLEPVLFEYQDQVYRVMYKMNEFPDRVIPVVNKLNMRSYHDDGRISVGEEINQDLVAGNKLHPFCRVFCIRDQIFVNIKGFIQPTDLKMNHGVADDPVSERIWTEFGRHVSASNANNIALFTFEKKN